MDCEKRIEKVCQANAVRFGHQPEQRAVAIETPRPAPLDHLQTWLVMAITRAGSPHAHLDFCM